MNPVTVIPKSGREEFRVQVQQFRHQAFVSLRVFYEGQNGQMHAGDQRVEIPLWCISEVVQALNDNLEKEKEITR